jgi:septal ring factor EnvC (AmiA/AmiB activator)
LTCTSSAAAALVLIVGLASPAPAQAPDTPQGNALSRRAAQRIQDLQREADALASRERTLLEELRRLEVERDLRTEQSDETARDIERITTQLNETETQMARLDQSAATERPVVAARLVEMYKLGNAGYLKLLLSINDLRDLGRAYRFVSVLERLDRARISGHQQTLNRLAAGRTELEQRRRELIAKQSAADRSRAAAAAAATDRERLIRQIDAQRDLNAQLIGELQMADRKLRETTGVPGAASGTGAAQIPISPFRGALPWPVSGPVVARFGRPQTASRANTLRNGVEIRATRGAPVAAVHDGAVTYAAFFMGFGNLVIVDHGGQAYSFYGNLGTMAVQQGAQIARGHSVGTVGQGLDGLPSLYFEMRIDGQPVDPLQWLGRR